jgi:glycosyltransferase involved in cell wall biosynthesis
MKIAFVTSEYVTEPTYSGGLANYLGRVTVALAQAGHHVSVFTRSQSNEMIEFQGVKVHRVVPLWDHRMMFDHIDPLIPRSLYNPYQDLKAAWCLWRRWQQAHQQIAFDIVQVANVMAVGLFFRNVRQVPVITRLSSYRPFWDRAAGIKETIGVKVRWQMEKLAITGCKNLYAPTYFVAKQVENGYRTHNVDIIETPFFPEQSTLDQTLYNEKLMGKSYALYFGRMTQMKGVHILAQALPSLLGRYPDMYMVFVGGTGTASPNGSIHEYFATYLKDFSDRIIFMESVRHDKLYPIIQHAKMVVLPSLIDNLPNTCLESMGLGKVVVATTGSCFEQVIEQRVSGILVEPGNPASLTQGIETAWLLDDTQRQIMQQKAQESIARLHPDTAIPKLVNYYQSLIEAA